MNFYLEVPSLKRKEEVEQLTKEYKLFNSSLTGTGSFKKYLDNYLEWLKQIKKEKSRLTKIPTLYFFLIRKHDNRIIGMINIRLKTTQKLKKIGGNIGYNIRPTERGKGYNKINLYLGLLECKRQKMKEVYISALKENEPSWKTIESFNPILTEEYYDDIYYHAYIKNYKIDLKEINFPQ